MQEQRTSRPLGNSAGGNAAVGHGGENRNDRGRHGRQRGPTVGRAGHIHICRRGGASQRAQ